MAFDYSSSGAILRSFASDRSKSRVRSADGLAFLETVRKAKGDQLDGGVLGSLRDLIADSGDEKVEWEILALGFQYLSEEFRDLLPEFYSGAADGKPLRGGAEVASILIKLLRHTEPRLRNLVCDKLSSFPVYVNMEKGAEAEREFVDAFIVPVLDDIERGLVRQQTTRPTALGSEANIPLDDTTGWGNLETHVKALHCLWKGSSRRMVWACIRPEGPHTSRINNIVLKKLSNNPNRYVREECLNLICTICVKMQNAPSLGDLAETHVESQAAGDPTEKPGIANITTPLVQVRAESGAGGGTIRTMGMGVVSYRKASENATTEAVFSGGSAVAEGSESDDMFSFRRAPHSDAGTSTGTGVSLDASSLIPGVEAVQERTQRQFDVSDPRGERKAPLLPLLTPSLHLAPLMSAAIERGLQDEWSQIRLAATTAARTFLEALLACQTFEIRGSSGSVALPVPPSPAVKAVPPAASGPAASSLSPISPSPENMTPAAANANPPQQQQQQVRDWTALLRAIYAAHNPEKVEQVPEILSQFRGRERFMLKKLKEKYPSMDADPEVAAVLAGGDPAPASAAAVAGRSSGGPTATTPPVDLSKNLSSSSAAAMFKGMLDSRARSSPSSSSPHMAEQQQQQQAVPSQFLAAYPELLPRLCMNRFYAADGVRQASHQAWRAVMGAQGGGSLLAGNIGLVVNYYSEQSRSNSHMVAEAALQAIKEVSTRLQRVQVVKVLPVVLQTLVACVQDHSWPVRDAAVGALGALVVAFSKEIADLEAGGLEYGDSQGQTDDADGGDDKRKETSGAGAVAVLVGACCTQLTDTIPSVRETAAVALANICMMRGNNDVHRELAREKVVVHLEDYLQGKARERKEMKKREKEVPSFLPLGMVTAAKKKKREEEEEHAKTNGGADKSKSKNKGEGKGERKDDKTLWRKGGGWGCCLDCMETREGSVEDAEEGCVSLLEELTPERVVLVASESLSKFVAAKYPQHLSLFQP